ncbi:MAG TPA: YdcF family protein [Terriglobia bacterium]|jgi:uncharacterized SAM-binding protein YcdF (DUF218 family)|nr:YdcF family protein [Terriglobia bacterium]
MAAAAAVPEPSRKRPRSRLRALSLTGLLLAVAVLALLRWGGFWLVSSDALPAHVDAAVILQGSISGEQARVAGAVRLLQEGIPAQAVLSVPGVSYWGTSVPEAARGYLEGKYGSEIAGRFVFCETGPDVNSTREEAEALLPCIQQHGWHTVVVVTSDYHSRRAGFLWRQAARQFPVQLWIDGVPDPEFRARGWWRKRIYAKTWYEEFTKLVWERVFE